MNNAAIRRFMGFNRSIYEPSFREGFLYHSSWDALMPVVEKIYSLNEYYRYVRETSGQYAEGVELCTNINMVYEQVVEFIKWLDEN